MTHYRKYQHHNKIDKKMIRMALLQGITLRASGGFYSMWTKQELTRLLHPFSIAPEGIFSRVVCELVEEGILKTSGKKSGTVYQITIPITEQFVPCAAAYCAAYYIPFDPQHRFCGACFKKHIKNIGVV
jgi:hypothetical protein